MAASIWQFIIMGTDSERLALPAPSADTKGRVFLATDVERFFYDDGADWNNLLFIPASHTHSQGQITGLITALDGLTTSIGAKPSAADVQALIDTSLGERTEQFGLVFTNGGDVALLGDGSPATKRY